MSQVKITGKVTGTDGKGLPYISVVVKAQFSAAPLTWKAITIFRADLKAGEYVMEFSGVGLKSKEQALRVGSENSYTANISLESRCSES